MPNHGKTVKSLLLIAFIITLASVFAVLPSQSKNISPSANQQKDVSQQSQMPVATYAASEPADPTARELRRAKNSRYDNRRPQPVSELADGIEELPLITHWWSDISALPSAQSAAVVIGDVIDGHAYLSNDKTGVYSEFTIHVKEVLKGSNQLPLNAGNSIVVEREGGAVRFPSGRVQKYRIAHQGMPRPGRQYVFFLKYNDLGQDFSILTAYELREGRVLPLDSVDQFAGFKNANVASFLDAVRNSSKGGNNQ